MGLLSVEVNEGINLLYVEGNNIKQSRDTVPL